MRTLEKSNPNGDSQNLNIFIRAIGSEIEHAQVKLITAANAQMLLHYWKIGHFILAHQKHLGWGAKVIEKISQAICSRYPEKKGYAPRNLKYMCQFARLYSLEAIKQFLWADQELKQPTIEKVILITRVLGKKKLFGQQAVEFGWSRSILKMQIDNGLFRRQIKKQKVNNFTATLPKPQSDLANYFFKDPYIFDLANFKEQADERNIEEELWHLLEQNPSNLI